jgi:hypothetical protein
MYVLILHVFFYRLVGSVSSPRANPSKTVRIQAKPGYQLLLNQLPNQDQTMISQRFNKLIPFVTDCANNSHVNPILQH